MEAEGKGKRILLIDDDRDLSELVRIRLEQAGFEVHHCVNGQEALKSVNEELPDAIVLDVDMPEKNGYTTLLEFKKKFDTSGHSRDGANIPVIVITGLAGGTIKDMVLSAGIYDFVQKPFSVSLLVEKINKAFDQRK